MATRDTFEKELSEFRPHVILADFSLPGFDGFEALAIARERCPEIPFLFVSGAIGEERAIESMKRGATDYVLKDRLSRLVPAVERALSEAEERSERKRAELALTRSEERHRLLLDVNNAIISSLDRKSLFEAIAHALSDIVPFDWAGLYLIDPLRDRVRVFTRGASGDAAESEHELEESVFRTLFDDSAAIVRSDLVKRRGRLTPAEEELSKEDVRAYVSVPLAVKNNTVGALAVGSEAPNRYSDDDLELLTEVGGPSRARRRELARLRRDLVVEVTTRSREHVSSRRDPHRARSRRHHR